MSSRVRRYVYGPVPSRRLGRSLGVDLVPFKTCSYDCTYCQLGIKERIVTEPNRGGSGSDVHDGVLTEGATR